MRAILHGSQALDKKKLSELIAFTVRILENKQTSIEQEMANLAKQMQI